MYKAYLDLDELILLCKDEIARNFIREAVGCYQIGAYRSCIISTWNAVVFDFIHKLRQLEQIGNNEASPMLQRFENMRQNNDFRNLWEFESSIPKYALLNFDFLSPIEKNDIERLHEDKSRCAHPSMVSIEEPFKATAELARYHLRSAVTHLLQRAPVQGRAALNRIWQDIKSAYFPTDLDSAVEYLREGPLGRARPTLIRKVVIGLTKSLINDDRSDSERKRQFSGLNATAHMYPVEVREIINFELSSNIFREVLDENWRKVVAYLSTVAIADNISEPYRRKTIEFIKSINVAEGFEWHHAEVLANATRIYFLVEPVMKKIREASPNSFLSIISSLPYKLSSSFDSVIPEKIQYIIDEFVESGSYDSASTNTAAILKISSYLDSDQKEAILLAFCENNQIYNSFDAIGGVIILFNQDTEQNQSLDPCWLSFRDKIHEKSCDDDARRSYYSELAKVTDTITSYHEKFPSTSRISS